MAQQMLQMRLFLAHRENYTIFSDLIGSTQTHVHTDRLLLSEMTHLLLKERLKTACSSRFASLGCQLRATEGGVVPPLPLLKISLSPQ